MAVLRIDAQDLHYTPLNQQIRKAICDGTKEIVIDNVLGQRFIGDGLRGDDVTITVNGVPGGDLAMFMSGPTVIVHGNADHAPGNTMNQGKVIIHGSAGDATAHSMRGGRVYVRDDIGYRGGIHMKQYMEKRPILVVGGSARAFLGEYMAGGLLIVLGMNGKVPVAERGVGSGIHGGEIFVRGKVEDKYLGVGAKQLPGDCRADGDDTPHHRGFCKIVRDRSGPASLGRILAYRSSECTAIWKQVYTGVMAMAEKSYLDLKSEVWDTKKCSGCGACVAVCPADALSFAEGEMIVSPKSNGYCKQATDNVPCGACYAVCPRTGDQPKETLGTFLELLSAKAAFEIPHRQSGGAVTAILANALDEGLIDAVVTVTEDPWTLRPSSAVITKSDVLIREAGSRYSWWVPLLAALKEAAITRKYTKIAVIGVPCAVQAAARIRASENDLLRPYAKSIRLVIGLFCTETFDYAALVHGKLETKYKLAPHEIKKLDVKGKLDILKQDNTHLSVPLVDLEDTIRPGCRICTDFSSLCADLSARRSREPCRVYDTCHPERDR